jgi:hypothetical protein
LNTIYYYSGGSTGFVYGKGGFWIELGWFWKVGVGWFYTVLGYMFVDMTGFTVVTGFVVTGFFVTEFVTIGYIIGFVWVLVGF